MWKYVARVKAQIGRSMLLYTLLPFLLHTTSALRCYTDVEATKVGHYLSWFMIHDYDKYINNNKKANIKKSAKNWGKQTIYWKRKPGMPCIRTVHLFCIEEWESALTRGLFFLFFFLKWIFLESGRILRSCNHYLLECQFSY